MLYGCCFSMQPSWWPMSLASPLNLVTKSFDMSFLAFLLIWLTTLRSMYFILIPHFYYSYQITRILMAGIRNLGLCPCPRCIIKKTDISALGTPMDDKRRMKLRRNTHHFHTKVSIARDLIYKGCQINSKPVNHFLKEESLVPTTVCPSFSFLKCV